ncbi:hypothetical protein ACAG25_23150 [Mycobacterium sp. pV006]|uniref:hypothetical protein n=1 Tax=Mycobacterium sp. pV006 TaxID=3238983 RepID=UPI00351B85C8
MATVYISNLGRGVPPLLACFITPHITAVAAAYLVGECLRAIFLWRSCIDGLDDRSASADVGIQLRQLVALFTSNGIAQLLPTLMQAIFAWSGPTAISQGAIALRVQAAATQITTSGLTMQNVARFAAVITRAGERADAVRRALIGEAIKVFSTAVLVALFGSATIIAARFFFHDSLSAIVLAGLSWSLVLVAAIPTVALTFWAGRGLIIAGFHRPLPIVIAISSSLSALAALALLPVIHAISALVASGICSVMTALGYTYILLRAGPSKLAERNRDQSD